VPENAFLAEGDVIAAQTIFGLCVPRLNDGNGTSIQGPLQRHVVIFGRGVDAQRKLLRGWNKTVVEVQPGKQQIEYHEDSDQWVPRGDVLRCIIDDGGPDGEVTIHIDEEELSLKDFGRLLRVHAGWGMRIAFVPEEYVTENPKVEIGDPKITGGE
jgi:hypothetical protein